MMKNVGQIDKVVRIILGIALISQVFIGLQTLWGLIGVIFLVTGLINFCPIYAALGLHTNQDEQASH